MLRIIDRYLIRAIITPFVISLLVFTFILEVPLLVDLAEKLLAKGVPAATVTRLMGTLIPQALAITIPMALLVGLLIGIGRLSGDREWVALQSCGVSVYRVARPVLLLAVLAWAATSWVIIWAVPDANQAFREITYRIVAQRVEGEIKPRVFFEDFPNHVLYVRDLAGDGAGWKDVFLADTTHPENPVVFLAESGRMVLDREQRTVELVLEHGTQHTSRAEAPQEYTVVRFEHLILKLDPESVFPRAGPQRGDRESTIPELQARIQELTRLGLSPHNPIMEIHKKFSIPVACLVFALLGVAFGLTTRRDGKLASFVMGIGVIFVYYIFMFTSQSAAKGGLVPASLAMWIPNIVLGGAGIVLVVIRSTSASRWQPLVTRFRRFALVVAASWNRITRSARPAPVQAAGRRGIAAAELRRTWLLGPNILDLYLGRIYAGIFALTFVGLLGLFHISTFIDLSTQLFKGAATGQMLLGYMWYMTPQYVYYCIPIAVLIGGLVTIGLLTRSSELVVMRACGVSLYRTTVPLVLFALLASGLLFGLEESVLAYSNRRAEAIRHVIRGGSPRTFDVLNRKWIVGRKGDIYNYLYFDPRRSELNSFSTFRFSPRAWRLQSRTFYKAVSFSGTATGLEDAVPWVAQNGWTREFDRRVEERSYKPVESATLLVEPPQYFATEQPDADRMTYQQLKRYIVELRAGGLNVVRLEVELYRKVSFPWVTLIMTIIAVPFAATTGQRGAMYAIGLGIVLALVYWTATNVFAALGAGGLIVPMMAAWAPNILFAALALYLLLAVRT